MILLMCAMHQYFSFTNNHKLTCYFRLWMLQAQGMRRARRSRVGAALCGRPYERQRTRSSPVADRATA
jgi:hypothetical protein